MRQVIDDIIVYGDPVDPGALEQIQRCRDTAAVACLMGDHHKGYAVPIGGVVAYVDAISPSGVGYDIGCGNKAVLTDADAGHVRTHIAKIMDSIQSRISFGMGRANGVSVDHDLFEDPIWKCQSNKFMHSLLGLARSQLGTVGSGNHYVDVFTDEQDRVWVGCHFGSRGLGHKIASEVLRRGEAKDGMDVDPLVLSVRSDLGSQYLKMMEVAGRYAYAGRDWVCDEVCRILGAKKLDEVHNHHNYAWNETHGGQEFWVVRKGATPAFPGQRGFVGGSMGDDSVILEGVDHEESRACLYSTVHGAGRVMSRTEARGKVDRKTGEVKSQGRISRQMMDDWIRPLGVELRGADVDESPYCYKRLDAVLRHHGNTVRVLHTLKPIGVAMAGKDTRDLYAD